MPSTAANGERWPCRKIAPLKSCKQCVTCGRTSFKTWNQLSELSETRCGLEIFYKTGRLSCLKKDPSDQYGKEKFRGWEFWEKKVFSGHIGNRCLILFLKVLKICYFWNFKMLVLEILTCWFIEMNGFTLNRIRNSREKKTQSIFKKSLRKCMFLKFILVIFMFVIDFC